MANAQPAPASAPDSTELLSYVIQECQDFFSHLGGVLTQAKEKGTLPPHTFKKGKADAKKDKVKRKPTAFNNFVRQKIVELRAAGKEENTNNVFANAVAAWKDLSEDQRKSYTDKFSKEGGEEVSLSDLDLPNSPSAVATDNQKASHDANKMDVDEHTDEDDEEGVEEHGHPAEAGEQHAEEAESEEDAEKTGAPEKTPTPAPHPAPSPAKKTPVGSPAPLKFFEDTAKKAQEDKKDKKKRKQKLEKEGAPAADVKVEAGDGAIKKKKKSKKDKDKPKTEA